MHAGKIVRSGDRSLALELEREGYGWADENEAPETAS